MDPEQSAPQPRARLLALVLALALRADARARDDHAALDLSGVREGHFELLSASSQQQGEVSAPRRSATPGASKTCSSRPARRSALGRGVAGWIRVPTLDVGGWLPACELLSIDRAKAAAGAPGVLVLAATGCFAAFHGARFVR